MLCVFIPYTGHLDDTLKQECVFAWFIIIVGQQSDFCLRWKELKVVPPPDGCSQMLPTLERYKKVVRHEYDQVSLISHMCYILRIHYISHTNLVSALHQVRLLYGCT